MDKGKRQTVTSGGYVIDTHAVAAAMLTRERIRAAALAVFEAPEPVDVSTVRAPEDDAAAFGDAA